MIHMVTDLRDRNREIMRILEITGEPILHGGQENFIFNILENIDNPNMQFDVLTPYICDNDKFKKLISSKGGKVYELNLDFRPWKSRKLIYKPVLDFLKSHKYDVIHIHSGSISVLAYESMAARKAGIKKIIVHSHSTGIKGFKHTIIQTAFSPILKACPTCYMACSREAGEMKYPKSVQSRVTVVKNGINLNRFKRNEGKGKELREKYKIPGDAFVIGHVGRFTEEKNHDFLMDVFRQVHEKTDNSYLLLIGEGELFEEVKRKANQLDLADRVVFTGVVDNPQDYYNIMDCFSLPSKYEGFSLVTLEAQANGIPCIVSKGVPEEVILTDQVTRLELKAEEWSDYIIKHKDSMQVKDNVETLRKSGYDIQTSAELIERKYCL